MNFEEIEKEWEILTTGSQRLLITMGIPASGKSLFASEFRKLDNWVVTERDEYRAEMSNGDINNYKYSKNKEARITSLQEKVIVDAFLAGKSVCVSDTNLNKNVRRHFYRLAEEHNVEVKVRYFTTTLEECIKRNQKRHHTVPEAVLIRMERVMRKEQGKYVQDRKKELEVTGLPSCVIVDIDGTLADMKGIRGPFEEEKVGWDKPRDFVVDYVKHLMDTGKKVFIFSGRTDSCKEDTVEWLHRHGLSKFEGLHMRKTGDCRSDTIVKEEMFDSVIKNKYSTHFVIDDRACVCKMWESLGLQVVNVGGFLADF